MKTPALIGALAVGLLASGCTSPPPPAAPAGDATAATVATNQPFADRLASADAGEFDDARRGFIARPSGQLLGPDGELLIDYDAFGFVAGEAPPTVNPSLWRHARLNAEIGLYQVTDGIHQLRGFDIANMTLIDSDGGWIVVDPLTSTESARAALAFARQHLGDKSVQAVIFTHSHVDHFGGALGVVSADDVKARAIPVIAPAGFLEEATSENVLVGTAMGRRSAYQFGKDLQRSAKGMVDTGLGKAVAYGSFGILTPTLLISAATEEHVVDGVRLVFHNVPGSEAPAELSFSLPDRKAYCGAEILAQTMHNLLPVRGAKVRDTLRWAGYLQEALDGLGDTEIYFASHNWPIWGNARIAGFIRAHRDVYKYTHDQSVRLINAGYTPREIADAVRLPESLQKHLGARGYYGDLRHNVKAVYQFYLGAYDGNPANLNPLPPSESATRYVALIGGADKAVAAAQTAFDQGDYRWVAELLNHVIYAQPDHQPARDLLIRTYEQMGYAAEAATWRNSYLTAAAELRNGPPETGVDRSRFIDVLMHTPTERFLEAMAAGLNGPEAEDVDMAINLVLTDSGESFVLWIENAVLHHRSGEAADANATLKLTKAMFVQMMAGAAGATDLLLSSDVDIDGSRIDLGRFLGLIDKPTGTFAIVTP